MTRNSPSDNPINAVIGANLINRRILAGMSQKALGEAITPSVTCQQMSKYEAGFNQISGRQLWEFSKVLDCDLADFFVGIEDHLPTYNKRGDGSMVTNYRKLPENQQVAVRELVVALARTVSIKLGASRG